MDIVSVSPWWLDIYNRLARAVLYGDGHIQVVYEPKPVDRRTVV